jgi:RNA-binding protein
MLSAGMHKDIKMLRSQAKVLEPIVTVGKNGITQGTIDLIYRELEQRQLIKIKLNKGAVGEGGKAERKAMAEEIAQKTGAMIIDQIGSVIVLYRP